MSTARFLCLGKSSISVGLCGVYKNLKPQTWSRMICTTSVVKTLRSDITEENYWTKNKRLNRPLSPHLTIYKPQVTSMLSLTHRGTGMFLSMVLTGFSVGMFVLPGSFPHYLSLVEAMNFGPFLIFLAKFGIAFPFLFHACNGIRHLVWDLGYGFSLRVLYRSGYFVVGTSTVLSAVASLL